MRGRSVVTADRNATSVPHATRFAVRSFAGLAAVLLAALMFALTLGLVASRSRPVSDADVAVVDELNRTVSGNQWVLAALRFLTNLGGAEAAWVLLSLTVAWLLVRRLPRLAVYAGVTGAGAWVLSSGTKVLVDRARPLVDLPVASASDASFPSGHALGSTVTYGVLLLVFLPAVPPRWRRAVVVAVAALVLVVGVTRIALGVHYPSDVLAGWALGVVWLGVTTTAFRRWREEEGLGRRDVSAGLAPEDGRELEPAPVHDAAFPDGWHTWAQLITAAVLIWGMLTGIGLLITDVFSAVEQFDVAVVEWFASIRTDQLTAIAVAVGRLGGTRGIMLVLVTAMTLALAVTGRWRPSLFLLVAVAGETALFLAVAAVVQRERPPVVHLVEVLPPTAAFPSGHVAAATATYGAIALLARARATGPLRHFAEVVAVIVPLLVAASRLYRGMHYPTDVLASMVYASAWLAVCWWALRPGSGLAPVASRTPSRAIESGSMQ